ncbi:non-ribosomal peptide synthetase [Micromonospora sp. CPCC 206061]|uniref:non-ribosomal peptide synthetase n=1 Tax=Micromonospora sp. CPCC 206061 TaxID=3122410 RepID=UPI002FEE6F5B
MTTRAGDLVSELEALGFQLWEDEGRLRFRGPKGLLSPERRAELRDHRQAVLAHLRENGAPALTPEPYRRHEPFPVTDVQAAYLLGRSATFALGGVGCHGYGELAFAELDPARLEEAFRALIARHDMLRAVVSPDGTQRVLAQVPPYRVAVTDVRDQPEQRAEQAVLRNRAEMDHRVYEPDRWPLFDLRVSRTAGGDLLHFSIDFLICDFVSIQVLLRELDQMYRGVEPAPLAVTYRDYLAADRRSRTGARYERDRAYWWSKVDTLPPAPELPLRTGADAASPPRFRRWQAVLEPERWAALRQRAGAHGVSPAGAVLAAYAEVVGRWSRQPRFTLDVTLLDRQPLAPDVDRLVGDFTSVTLLEVDPGAAGALAQTFAQRAGALRDQLWRDLDHRLCSGVEVMREIGRRRGAGNALMPVVFTSAIGLAGAGGDASTFGGEPLYGISQTPQVWIDCQNIERGGTLATNWDVREGVFPDGVVDDMFAAYTALLGALATSDAAWRETDPVRLPAATVACRERVNDTAAPVPDVLLHEPVLAQAVRSPQRVAVIGGGRSYTYREVVARATATAAVLRERGCRPGDLVALVMDKGVEQVVGALGTLIAGGVYLPVDTTQPPARREAIVADAGARYRLTQSWIAGAVDKAIAVDLVEPASGPPDPALRARDDLAYVIYTSGSTGSPKGVMISHAAAVNTIVDINQRFAVGPEDRVLGLAHLGFDLSVYDIFGPLATGGCLVLPDPGRQADPSHWAELMAANGVTLWNSVPAQLQMLVDYLRAVPAGPRPAPRLALLSGDWIPVALPDQARAVLPGVDLVSLGGATEASIWSIAYPIAEVPAHWRSVPYGTPLANQTFHVLDAAGRPCPDWVAGELYIGGAGVALGYLGDEERTARRFVRDPATGERRYRTGDFGRYRPDGVIEFLGREDLQVKIRGHRIELAEVEAAVASCPGVGAAVALADGEPPLGRRLAAVVEPARRDPEPVPDGLAAAASSAGAAVLSDVDLDGYLRYTRDLDRAALVAMVCALQRAGLFGAPGATHGLDEVLSASAVAPRHHRLVRRWLRSLVAEGVLGVEPDGQYRLAQPVNELALAQAWRRVDGGPVPPAEAPLVDYFRASTAHLPALLRGDTDPLRLLFPEGRLEVSANLYEEALFNRWANAAAGAVVRAIARAGKPRSPLRVLEVGAGGGGTTAAVLDGLDDWPVDYLYTDLSPFFLNAGRERFGGRAGVRFAPLDLDLDGGPGGDPVVAGQYDIIVAGDVLHATRDVDATMGRLRDLLVPGGWLVFLEMTRDHYQIMTSLELLVRPEETGSEQADRRSGRDLTFLDRTEWARVVAQAGGELAVCLPEATERVLPELGLHVFAARFKSDRCHVEAEEIRAHVASRLPEYMVPTHVRVVDALPLTGNGKVDRARVASLVAPATAGVRERQDGAAPADDLEREIAAIWAEVLQVPEVGRDDDFYGLGGDSLLAAQLVGRVTEEVRYAASMFFDQVLRLMLEGRTVAAFAAALRTERPADDPPVQAEAASGPAAVVTALGGDGPVAWVLVPDGGGDLSAYGPVRDALAGRGRVLGLAPPDRDRYLAVQPAALVGHLAVRYADALAQELGGAPVHLVGSGFGAIVAVETARALAEAGAPVAGLTVIGRPAAGAEAADPVPAHSLSAAERYQPEPYAGDLTVFCAAAEVAAQEAYWREVCLGDVVVRPLPDGAAAGLEAGLLTPAAAAAAAAALGGRA